MTLKIRIKPLGKENVAVTRLILCTNYFHIVYIFVGYQVISYPASNYNLTDIVNWFSTMNVFFYLSDKKAHASISVFYRSFVVFHL